MPPRNCAFQGSAHRALLTEDTEKVAMPPSIIEAPGINILPYVLLPLAGPEEFDLEVTTFWIGRRVSSDTLTP